MIFFEINKTFHRYDESFLLLNHILLLQYLAKNIGTKIIGIEDKEKKFLIKEDGYEVEDPFFKQWIVLQSGTAV